MLAEKPPAVINNEGLTHLPTRAYLRIQEAADYFGVCSRTIRRWIERGTLKAIKIGGSVRITRDSVISRMIQGKKVDIN